MTDHPFDKAALIEELREEVLSLAPKVGLDPVQTKKALEQGDVFGVLEMLIPKLHGKGPFNETSALLLQGACEELLRIKAFSHPGEQGKEVPQVVFGTSGHRGEIGTGLTLVHVHAIIAAFIHMVDHLEPHERAAHFFTADLERVKAMGVVIGHDNRLFNSDFSAYAAHLFLNAGWKVLYAGLASTPEFSRVVPHMKWAAAVNFTPSHNPFRYGGIKISPADGGLAGTDLTGPLAQLANVALQEISPKEWPDYAELDELVGESLADLEWVDIHDLYLKCLADHPVIRLDDLCREIGGMFGQITIVADPTWGAATPVYKRLQERVGPWVMEVIHTDEDPYFGGQTTEPNEQTLSDALGLLKTSRAAFKVAVRNDPDADRALVGDDGGGIKMNRFAPLVMKYLMDLGQEGGMATTIPTSHLGPRFAQSHNRALMITPTGFKYFRPFFTNHTALMAYEESDGISIAGHSLDKDGILALLLAIRIVLHYKKPLSQLVEELEAQQGRHYWLQQTFPISIPADKARKKLDALKDLTPGRTVSHQGKTLEIAQVNTEDGYKFVFTDGTWFMMRPSGTEPKIRVYAETTESEAATQALCQTAKQLALKAVEG
ncbi:MAG: hypothetical protein OEV94_11550 [Deltaproteobacteria bacterium]|nr:hypothetical protein [Deltaproteobacteria bacterium]